MTLLSILPRERTACERREDLQDLFARRYPELLGWALQLTNGDRAAAEELVHDAYVDFARALPDLQTFGNLNGYLYNALRNLNISRIRRAWKHSHEELDVLEYDSLQSRLRLHAKPDVAELREHLLRLCVYLCLRKDSVRSASILLLRFFRNYYPEEIARITHLSRNAVNVQILRARTEAKLFLAHPENLDEDPELVAKMSVPAAWRSVEIDAFLRRLSMVIRSSQSGECFSAEQLETMYGPHPEAPDTAQLAHLVSCDACLKRVSKLIGQPPNDPLAPAVSGGRRRSPKQVLADAEETVRDLFDHQPSVLLLAVNGTDVLECRVTAEAMEQVAVLSPGIRPEFVEVFNHVGTRLLKIDVLSTPPDGPVELSHQVPLAGERTLEVTVEWYGPEPRLRLRYSGASAGDEPVFSTLELEALGHSAAIADAPARERRDTSVFSRLRRYFKDKGAFLPVFAVGLALGIGPLVYYQFQRRHRPAVSVGAILKQSVEAENAANRFPGVSHHIVRFEERSEAGAIQRSGRVETWRDPTRVAQRWYDAQGKLVAGEWKDGKEKSQLLENGRLHDGAADCIQPNQAWSCDLSLQSIEWMVGNKAVWKATETDKEYVISLDNSESPNNSSSGPRLVRATIQLDRHSLHTREMHLWIREPRATREYTYEEVDYERLPKIDDSSIFSPDRDSNLSKDPRSTSRPRFNSYSNPRIAHLQLQALSILDAIGNDAGQPIQVERTRNGKLLIEGVVSSDAEARRVRAMFAAIASDPLVDLRVLSVEELKKLRKSRSSAAPELKSYEVEPAPRLADELLHAHFRSLGYRGDELERQVRQFCDDVLDQSASVLRLAWEMNDFNKTFTSREVAALPEPDKRTWFALLNRHVQAVSLHTAALEQKIAWMMPVPAADPVNGPAPPPIDTLPPAEMVDRTLRSATELNHALRVQLLASHDPIDRSSVDPETISAALFDVERSLTGVHALCMQYETLLKQP